MKHAGIHWPENAGGEHPNRETIIAMPGAQGAVLICSPSARYHYQYARERCPGAIVVWRAIPRQGKLPAQLGWEPNRVSDEVLNLWDEQPHGGTEWFLPLNELQFVRENGAPFPGYALMSEHLGRLRLQLRRKFTQRYPGTAVRLMFPGWVPQDDGDRLSEWASEATQWDAVCLHAYGSAETMQHRYQSYRDAFGPDMPIFVGEWNANHEGHDERAALAMWSEIANTDPAFLGATYYIWETRNDGEHDLSIWGNPARLDLFRNPPVASIPEPEPAPMPTYRLPTWTPAYQDIRDGAIQVADESGLPRRRLLGLCLAESGFGLQSFDRWASIERSKRMAAAIKAEDWPLVEAIFSEIPPTGSMDISFGPCHQTWRYGPDFNGNPYDLAAIMEFRAKLISDHGYALRLAADTLKRLDARYGPHNDQTSLERYNKPNAPVSAGVRANYERSLAEADRILAELAPAPSPVPVPEPVPEPEPIPPAPARPEYLFGFKDLADRLGHHVVGQPVTSEQPFRPDELTVQYTERGVMLYHGPSNRPYFLDGHGVAIAPPAAPAALVDLRGALPTRPGTSGQYPLRNLAAVDSVDIHYTASQSTGTPQGIAAYQVGPGAQEAFPAIAYHIIVDGAGVAYLCHAPDRRVWHNGGAGRNERAVGICYIGNDRPNAAQLAGLRTAIRWCQAQLGRTLAVAGHRDSYSTLCPGSSWPSWRQEILP